MMMAVMTSVQKIPNVRGGINRDLAQPGLLCYVLYSVKLGCGDSVSIWIINDLEGCFN